MATVMPASCAARNACALRGLIVWLKVGNSVPSMSIATRRTGGCMQLVYLEVGHGIVKVRLKAKDSSGAFQVLTNCGRLKIALEEPFQSTLSTLAAWSGSVPTVTLCWRRRQKPTGALHVAEH